MKKLIFTGVIAALGGFPVIAPAQSLPAVPAGAVICRPAKAGETANATFGKASLMCRKVDVAKVMAAEKKLMSMMKPNMTAAETKQMHAASAAMNAEFGLSYPGFDANTNN